MIHNNQREFQLMITSHHPYVINNIDLNSWAVVIREGDRIYTKNAKELGLGKSHHEAFLQLLNLKEFTEGIK
jgi:hypothetical protein